MIIERLKGEAATGEIADGREEPKIHVKMQADVRRTAGCASVSRSVSFVSG